MAQFDVYDTPLLTLRQQFPYMAVLQSDRLQKASERIVAPLIEAKGSKVPRGLLNLPVWIEEGREKREYLLLLMALTTVSAASLSRPVASIAHSRDEITRSLELLLLR
ncbi:MAG: CcdB family protein [Rickettsiales bacterium]|nr:CcdB family protein [Rickettsiales bacterium]